MKKNLLLIFVLSLMTILFAGCADDKGEPNIIYEKDDNTDTGTDIWLSGTASSGQIRCARPR